MSKIRFSIILYLSTLLLISTSNIAFGQQSSTRDTVIHRSSDTSGILRAIPQTEMYVMDVKKVSKHRIRVKEAMKYIGKERAVEGKVFGYLQKDGFIDVYMGATYPDHFLLVTLTGKCQTLVSRINGKRIRVIGTITTYKSKPAIMIGDEKQIVFL
jgi:hypothetical protein